MINSSCARQRRRSSTFIATVSESLFPIRPHGERILPQSPSSGISRVHFQGQAFIVPDHHPSAVCDETSKERPKKIGIHHISLSSLHVMTEPRNPAEARESIIDRDLSGIFHLWLKCPRTSLLLPVCAETWMSDWAVFVSAMVCVSVSPALCVWVSVYVCFCVRCVVSVSLCVRLYPLPAPW